MTPYDVYYKIKLMFVDRKKCPKCGAIPFEHGFYPNAHYYCKSCHLWENEEKIGGEDKSGKGIRSNTDV